MSAHFEDVDDLDSAGAVYVYEDRGDGTVARLTADPPSVDEEFGALTQNLDSHFGSVDSLLKAENDLFRMLDSLPFYTYINIGLESADPETLSGLKKPISARAVRDAFARMMDINKSCKNIEITANMVLGKNLPPGHLTSLLALTRESMDHFYSKCSIYISPLSDGQTRREILAAFSRIKRLSRVPTYLYLIQRL